MSICKPCERKRKVPALQPVLYICICIEDTSSSEYSTLEFDIKLEVKMEANRKLRGFVKGKLMPFHRATKPSSTVQYISSKIKPNQSSPSTAPLGFVVHQDYAVAQPNQKAVSFIVPPDHNNRDLVVLSKYDNLYGLAADESVDMKAATYISSVQERFKLERMNSERKKCQDMQLSA
ncbi:uncharacterized protein LOC121251537 [Juglans microcarpa x Juglans regia]|uniref:uncharacterized protein LOC121251537 n=1 Tax=Juglans microcarpa x Juglans regia TaxID=2249226 RepID=UPI001B7E89B6|nr:uncharacterized protein LOC121251537 [Juglans microcarpa x Juglans regia]